MGLGCCKSLCFWVKGQHVSVWTDSGDQKTQLKMWAEAFKPVKVDGIRGNRSEWHPKMKSTDRNDRRQQITGGEVSVFSVSVTYYEDEKKKLRAQINPTIRQRWKLCLILEQLDAFRQELYNFNAVSVSSALHKKCAVYFLTRSVLLFFDYFIARQLYHL